MWLLLIIPPLIIFGVLIGFVGLNGLWESLITFFNVLMAAILTTNFFEPASTWLDSKMPTFTYIIDVLVIWVLFIVFFIVFNLITSYLSKVKVKFHRWVDLAGGVFLSSWTAWIVISLLFTSLHVAPLPLNGFGGAFQKEPEAKMFFGMAPDRKWLAYMHKLSQGAFAKEPPADDPEKHLFDPEGKFILTYAGRREVFETTESLRVRREFGKGMIEEGRIVER